MSQCTHTEIVPNNEPHNQPHEGHADIYKKVREIGEQTPARHLAATALLQKHQQQQRQTADGRRNGTHLGRSDGVVDVLALGQVRILFALASGIVGAVVVVDGKLKNAQTDILLGVGIDGSVRGGTVRGVREEFATGQHGTVQGDGRPRAAQDEPHRQALEQARHDMDESESNTIIAMMCFESIVVLIVKDSVLLVRSSFVVL